MKAAAIVVAGLLAFTWACRRKTPQVAAGERATAPVAGYLDEGPPVPPPPAQAKKTPSRVKVPPGFELVRRAPPGFSAGDARKVALKLIPEREYLNRGRSFWYRLELQNQGREPLLWEEKDSFFEDGYLRDAHVQFYVTQPDGRVVRMLPPHDDYGSPKEEAGPIRVTLKSGETLVSRPWSYQGGGGSGQVWGPFRELASRYDFGFLGRYKIRAVLKRPELGVVESNDVEFDVVP